VSLEEILGTARVDSHRPRFRFTSAAIGVLVFVLLAGGSDAQTVPIPDAHGSVTNSLLANQPRKVANDSIRPFHIAVSEEALVDLRRRITATRWPDRETVNDRSQGVQLATMQALVRYWGTDYDWRKAEAKLNALPQFVTTIDGVDIQFTHVRSRYPNAMPLIMTHGWPGSIFELLKVIGPLTEPPAYGGRAEDAFDLVLPSLPGFGFSGRPQVTGWNPDHIARAWAELMRRLGYTRYVAQGGDWGSAITDNMAAQKPEGLLGIHVNMPATVPPEIAKALQAGDPPPPGLTPEEKTAYEALDALYKKGSGFALIMVTRRQTLGYSLADSPVGLAAWIYDKLADWTDTGGHPEKALTRDEMLDDITLYWLTNTATSSARIYWETVSIAINFNAVDISYGEKTRPGHCPEQQLIAQLPSMINQAREVPFATGDPRHP
jgi:pimeloyl-ACP methyl ester carboxylesterase